MIGWIDTQGQGKRGNRKISVQGLHGLLSEPCPVRTTGYGAITLISPMAPSPHYTMWLAFASEVEQPLSPSHEGI